jgi:hypothetical protein
MKALREKFKLDDVVAGAGSELEKFVKLRDWVAKQWRFEAPARHYPAWDADDILTARTGFCVQFAIVFMQCATALGYQTRFLFGDNSAVGHEVTEVWSNEFGKWIYMDNSNNFHHVDPRTGVPLNMMDVRDLILRTYYAGNVADRTNRPAQRVTSPDIATCYGLQMKPVGPKNETMDAGGKDGRFYVPLKWMQLRYMDRNNFYGQPLPVPKTQGATWDYSDYWLWDDGRQEPVWRYRHVTARRSDLQWTINQVRYAVECDPQPNTLRVQMVTQTPSFDTFLVNANGGGWTPSGSSFLWTLQPGRNRLEMRVRNTSGVEGIVSFIELDCE